MAKKKRYILIILAVLFAMVAMAVLGTILIGCWLSSGDHIEKADAIVVLAGDPRRALYAADLYKQGYAPVIYVSKPNRTPAEKAIDDIGIPYPRQEEINREILTRKGVPATSIRVFGKALYSTLEESGAIKKIVGEGTIKSLIIVTSPYHVGRVKLIFSRVLNKDTKVTVTGTTYESFPSKWWERRDSAVAVVMEGAKIVFFLFGGKFHE